MYGTLQVGQLNGHASRWSGTPGSRIDLHPAWAESSIATAVWGNQQVGSAYATGSTSRATLWYGSAASSVNLHPGGTAVRSEATAVAAGQQGGVVEYPFPGGGTIPHAAVAEALSVKHTPFAP